MLIMIFILLHYAAEHFLFIFHSKVFILSLLLGLIFHIWYKNRNLPPGPWGVPVFGYLPFLRKQQEIKFAKLSKIYGNVMSVTIGSKLVVILGDYAAIKEAFVKKGDIFSGRPNDLMFKISEKEKGVVLSEGEHWKTHRRFALSVLKEYGMGKLSLEMKMQEEISRCLEEIAKFNGTPMDPEYLLSFSVCNNFAAMAFGKRYRYSDKSFGEHIAAIEKTHKFFKPLLARSFLPWVNYLPFSNKITKFSLFVKTRLILDSFIDKQISSHEENYIQGSRKDYIDAYLTRRIELVQKCGKEGFFDRITLEGNLLQMFSAGVDTATNTLRWALLFMAAHPDIQKKVQMEIDDVVGMSRLPSMADRPQMPYTVATLFEISRCGSLVPLNVCHSNIRETELFGYRIPKRTYILSNLYAVHHDPLLWKDPELFNPMRFIDDNGKIETSEFLIPFSLGKRACIGESFAQMELFIYFSSILQRFTISSEEGSTISLEYELGIVRSPKPFKICAVPRPNYEVNCGNT